MKKEKDGILAESQLSRERYGLRLPDYILAPVAALPAVLWAYQHIGTSIGWDDLFYMDLSQYTTKEAWVLNRYGHIYLQKIFFWLMNDSFSGAKAYWCFLYFSAVVLIYWCAKMLAGKGGTVIGLLAALFFCSQPIFYEWAGSTDADLTVMFLTTLGTFVYLAFLVNRFGKYRYLIIMALGLIFFWVMKSKESGLCMGILLLGLGEDQNGAYSIRRLIRDIGWVCAGMATGCVLLMFLDMVFLKDFWFSVRPSSIKGLFAYNTGTWKHDNGTSWYTILLFGSNPMLAAFLLYLLVGWKPIDRDRLSKHERLVWLLPLTFIFFLIAVAIPIRTYAVPSTHRYLAPAIAGICIWAAQFFRFRTIMSGSEEAGPKTPNLFPKALINFVAVLIAFFIVLFLMPRLPKWTEGAGWKSADRLYETAILPLATTGILIYSAVLRKRGPTALFVFSLCLFFIVYFPLDVGTGSLEERVVAQRSEWRYAPYHVFAGELQVDKNVKILISKSIYANTKMLGRDLESQCWMFNVFFNQELYYGNFINGTAEDILKGNYNYAFLTFDDWKSIGEKPETLRLKQNYIARSDMSTQVVFLKRR